MLVPNLDGSWAMNQNLQVFIYIGPTKGQSQSNTMLYSTRKAYLPKATMPFFLVMFCLRGREIKSSSALRILYKDR